MDPERTTPDLLVTRAGATQWRALDDERVVGLAEALYRPDGRVFLSIDTWHDAVFDRLAAALLADLPRPLHTVVDEADHDLRTRWERAGLTTRRREWEYVVPTDPAVTGLGAVRAPTGTTVVPLGGADPDRLRTLDRTVRAELAANGGWQRMPAEVVPLPPGVTVLDPTAYAVAEHDGAYVGLLRLASRTRRPRIGLIAVRADHRRRGVARALLAEVLGSLHRGGTASATAEAQELEPGAVALIEGVGARRAGSNLELVVER